jgi:hypothetical protein
MDFTYKASKIELIKYIKDFPPNKIWWDFTFYVFEYEVFYIQIECISECADSQNRITHH